MLYRPYSLYRYLLLYLRLLRLLPRCNALQVRGVNRREKAIRNIRIDFRGGSMPLPRCGRNREPIDCISNLYKKDIFPLSVQLIVSLSVIIYIYIYGLRLGCNYIRLLLKPKSAQAISAIARVNYSSRQVLKTYLITYLAESLFLSTQVILYLSNIGRSQI